jgi:hypothetical protein
VVSGDITYTGYIHTKETINSDTITHTGQDCVYEVSTSWFKSDKLIFKKGLLVAILKPGDQGYNEAKPNVNVSFSVDWDDVTGKPNTFKPESHTHSQYAYASSLTTLNNTVNGLSNTLSSLSNTVNNLAARVSALESSGNTPTPEPEPTTPTE